MKIKVLVVLEALAGFVFVFGMLYLTAFMAAALG